MPFSTAPTYRKPEGACAPTAKSGNFRRALRRPRCQRAGYKHSPLARLRRALARVFDPVEAASPPKRPCGRRSSLAPAEAPLQAPTPACAGIPPGFWQRHVIHLKRWPGNQDEKYHFMENISFRNKFTSTKNPRVFQSKELAPKTRPNNMASVACFFRKLAGREGRRYINHNFRIRPMVPPL